MKKWILFLALISITGTSLFAQDKFYTKSGKVDFYSKAALEDIEAKNKTASAIIDSKSGFNSIFCTNEKLRL